MKRRLLSAFLAVMMVLTMAPVAFAADGVEPIDGTGSSEAAPAKTLPFVKSKCTKKQKYFL